MWHVVVFCFVSLLTSFARVRKSDSHSTVRFSWCKCTRMARGTHTAAHAHTNANTQILPTRKHRHKHANEGEDNSSAT